MFVPKLKLTLLARRIQITISQVKKHNNNKNFFVSEYLYPPQKENF